MAGSSDTTAQVVFGLGEMTGTILGLVASASPQAFSPFCRSVEHSAALMLLQLLNPLR